jgi:hypothetical protein
MVGKWAVVTVAQKKCFNAALLSGETGGVYAAKGMS